MDLDWHKSYELGVPFIDEDHKNLLRLMREIRDAIQADDMVRSAGLLNTLFIDAVKHFSGEEDFLGDIGYPGLNEHMAYHDQLLEQARLMVSICKGEQVEHDVTACFDAMARFLVDDVLKGDLMFKPYLEQLEIIDSPPLH